MSASIIHIAYNLSVKLLYILILCIPHIVPYLLPSGYHELYAPDLLVKHVLHSCCKNIFCYPVYPEFFLSQLQSSTWVLEMLLHFSSDAALSKRNLLSSPPD